MDTIYSLLKRAKELKNKSQVDSITPEEVGKLHEDSLAYIASLEQSTDGLGIKKVYQSKSAMEADTDPVGTNGKVLRYGQLVSIYDDAHADSSENGNIYAYQKPGWLLMGKVSGLSVVQELGDSATKVMSQKAVTEALGKVTTDDGKSLQEVSETVSTLDVQINGKQKEIIANIPNIIIKGDGTTRVFEGFSTSDFFAIPEGSTIVFKGLWKNEAPYHGVHLYDENKNALTTQINTGLVVDSLDAKSYPGLKYIRISGRAADNPSAILSRQGQFQKLATDVSAEIEEVKRDTPIRTKNIGSFGSLTTISATSMLGAKCSMATVSNGVYTDSEAGFIQNVEIISTKGLATFGVGVLDRNNKAVITTTFDVELPISGYNKVFILDKNISISPGQQLFFFNGKNNVQIFWGVTTDKSYISQQGWYGSKENMTIYGVHGSVLLFNLRYSVVQYDSPFAEKAQVDEVKKQIEVLQKAQYVYDGQNRPYKLRVVNGKIVPISANYKEVVVLGNSLTWHEYWGGGTDSWGGENRSMASTTDEVSWPYLLQRILQKREPTAKVTGVMMRAWESATDSNRDITSPSLSGNKKLLDDALTPTTDLIMFRAGENGATSGGDGYKNEILALIDYCLTKSPLATIVLCEEFWHDPVKDKAIYNAALERGYQYISAGTQFSKYVEMRGDFHLDSKDRHELLLHSGVLSHMADHGFYLWANHVAKNLGYEKEQLNELHNIEIKSTLSKGFKIKDTESPHKALVTILTYESTPPTISVRTKSGQAIETNSHDLTGVIENYTTAFTFLMPDEDVVVILA